MRRFESFKRISIGDGGILVKMLRMCSTAMVLPGFLWAVGEIPFGDSLNVRFVGDYSPVYSCRNVKIRWPYAFLCEEEGLEIVDISDPSSPSHVGLCETPFHYIEDVAISESSPDYAYASEETHFDVIKIQDPSNPFIVAQSLVYDDGEDIVCSFPYVYHAVRMDGMLIFDVSDPYHPDSLGNWFVPGHPPGSFAYGVAIYRQKINKTYALLACCYSGLRIVDVSDPTNPNEVGMLDKDVFHVTVAGSLAYLSSAMEGLYVVDISDPYNPYIIGHWNQGGCLRCVVSRLYAYVADYGTGQLWVIDTSNPANPQTVGYYDTPGRPRGIAVRRGYIYVSEGDFRIYQFIDDESPEVTVISPNGGEIFEVGDTCDITWLATDNVGVDSVGILYSTDAGLSWDTIATGEPNDSLYEWIIPSTPSESCLVKILAYDPGLNMGEDESDSLFRIRTSGVGGSAPVIRPFLTVSPNPFSEHMEIAFSPGDAGEVSLRIYDATGRLVKEFIPPTASTALTWDGRDESGRKVRSGVYFLRFEAGEYRATEKLLFLSPRP